MNKKILAPIGAALAMLAVSAGTTFALFTSQASSEIKISAGKVDVTFDVSNLKMFSGKYDNSAQKYIDEDVTANEKFTNGGTVTLDENNLTLTNISPMDKVEFDVDFINSSTIVTKARSFIEVADEIPSALIDALTINYDGAEIIDGVFYSKYKVLDVGETLEKVHVIIDFPNHDNDGHNDNQYQTLSLNFTMGVEAIQGNAHVEDWKQEGVYFIDTIEDFEEFSTNVNGGKTYSGEKVILKSDLDLTGVTWTPIGNVSSYPSDSFAGIFNGGGHKVSNMTCVDTTENYAAAGLFGSLVGTVKNLTLENPTVSSTHYAGGIVGYHSSGAALIENCHVVGGKISSTPELLNGEYDNGDKVGGIIGYCTSAMTVKDCSVDGLTISAYRDLGGIGGAVSGTFTGNSVKNTTIIQDNTNGYKTNIDTYHEIIGRDLGVTESGNTFVNVTLKSI